jgi:hypothetical protein
MSKYSNIHRGWRTIGNRKIYFRSKWEANYAIYLEWQKANAFIIQWFHEPKTFWFDGIKRGCVSYLPDFQVIDLTGRNRWIEVKGWMDAKSKTKIKRFKKYFPEERLDVIDAKWFRVNCPKLKLIIPNWE